MICLVYIFKQQTKHIFVLTSSLTGSSILFFQAGLLSRRFQSLIFCLWAKAWWIPVWVTSLHFMVGIALTSADLQPDNNRTHLEKKAVWNEGDNDTRLLQLKALAIMLLYGKRATSRRSNTMSYKWIWSSVYGIQELEAVNSLRDPGCFSRAKLCSCARLLIKREGLTVIFSSRPNLGVPFFPWEIFYKVI